MSIVASSVVRFSRQMTRFYNAAFDAFGQRHHLTMREIHVLLFLANNPQLDTARDICQKRGLLKSQVSQGVDMLCKQGILERQADANDRRCVHLRLTEHGQVLGQEAQITQQKWWAQLTASLTLEQQQQTEIIMAKLLATADALEEA